MHRFFTSKSENEVEEEIEAENEKENLQDLACDARKELVPRYTRAKNVNNKWVYLAQIGNREFQEIEVTICKNPQQKCVNDIDSPHGEGSTLCRQIFSTQKLLALDNEGNVNVDTFELPSACVCKTKIRSPFDIVNTRSFLPKKFTFAKDICGVKEPTQTLNHDRFLRGRTDLDAEEDEKTPDSTLKTAANSVTPCSDSELDTICEDESIEKYPEDAIKLILYRHKLFANREYFQRLFGRPCLTSKPEELTTRLGFDLEETALCETVETYIFPKKAKNSKGVWKYIVNTDDYRQGVSVHRCLQQIHKRPCLYAGSQGINPEATECRQMFSKHSLLSIGLDGRVDYDTFSIPTACVCHIVDKEIFFF